MKAGEGIEARLAELLEARGFWVILELSSASVIAMELTGTGGVIPSYILSAIGLVLLVRFLVMLGHERVYTPDVLMSAVALATALTGYWKEGAIVMILYSIAEIMEETAEKLALRRLTGLIRIIPDTVEVVVGGVVRRVRSSEVKPGDIVLVRRGEAVPVDGILLDRGTFDTRYITGESDPVSLNPGDPVVSGYINLGDPVKIRALKRAGDSTLQRIVSISLEFLERKSRIERLVESISPPLTVAVLTVSLAAFEAFGIYGLVSVLVAGCPSAYLISSASSTMLAIAVMARRGIIVKGGVPLETSRNVRTVVLDKTGTLTLGKPRLKAVKTPMGIDTGDMLRLAASAAVASRHPLSMVIVSEARRRGIEVKPPSRVKEYPGKGLEAVVNGEIVKIGSRTFIGFDDSYTCDGPVVFVSTSSGKGYLCFEDEVREEARWVVESLRRRGVRVVIASGDKKVNVEKVAKAIGVDEYYYEMSPEDKLKLISRFKSNNGKVAMVGDGINDLEAMAAADLGVAIGDIDVVADVADVVIPRLGSLTSVLDAGKTYFNALMLAFAAATLIKAIAIAGGFTQTIPLWAVAFLGDDGSTITGVIVAASLFMAKFKGI